MSNDPRDTTVDLGILTFCFNDWKSLGSLTRDLDRVLVAAGKRARLLVIDDGSTETRSSDDLVPSFNALDVEIVRLCRNVGHQRAIAVGLCLLSTQRFARPVVVMDCDGEDKPDDLLRLLGELTDNRIECVFAERGRRSEGVFFRFGYFWYRTTHRVLTGQTVRFGNFAALHAKVVDRIVLDPNLMNHFAATILSGRYRYMSIRCNRGFRYFGQSRMNVERLITHGLSAISCFADRVATRLLLIFSCAFGMSVLGIVAVVAVKLGTALAIPGWATTAALGFAVMGSQFAVASLLFAFGVLASRSLHRSVPFEVFKTLIDPTRPPA